MAGFLFISVFRFRNDKLGKYSVEPAANHSRRFDPEKSRAVTSAQLALPDCVKELQTVTLQFWERDVNTIEEHRVLEGCIIFRERQIIPH